MNMRSGVPPPDQQGSGLLSQEENDQIFHLLGPRCLTLSTTVVVLYTTTAPDHCEWVKKDTGVLCLVKDNARRSYFFRLYCPVRRRLIWEHEVYNEISYLAPRPFLHTFEAEDCIVAFNFASQEEAEWLRGVLLKKLDEKKQKRERRARNFQRESQSQSEWGGGSPVVNGSATPFSHQKNSVANKGLQEPRRRKEKDGKRRLTKADIGKPQHFRHVSHVGFDPNKGFELNTDSTELKEFFEKAGVSDNQLQDKATREFIYDFIQKHGGLDAVTKDIRPPPVPARTTAASRAAPPPPPSRTGPLPPAPPTHTPPPPPPLRTLPQRPQEPPQTHWTPPPPPPPVSPAVVPPPPPPPPVFSHPPDDEPSFSVSAPPPLPPTTADPRSALMDAIRSGKQLKRVDVDDNKSVKSDSRGELLDQIRQGVELKPLSDVDDNKSVKSDSRGELLDQIRHGIELKPVQHDSRPAGNSVPEDGLAGALARALAERSRAIHSDSSASSNEDEEDEDDEWED